MSQAFLGSCMPVAFGFAPKGWVICAGQLLPISQNTALFSLLGNTFGGDGITTFGLPDMRGRAAQGSDGSYLLGQTVGTEAVTLNQQQMPLHTHVGIATSTKGSLPKPATNMLGGANMYQASPPDPAAQVMNIQAIAPAGGNQPHVNQSPYLVITWIIALQGIFPSQN